MIKALLCKATPEINLSKFYSIFLLFTFSSCLLLGSCKGNKIKRAGNEPVRIDSFNLPAPKPLSAAEATVIKTRGEVWYEKYIAKSNFNGSIMLVKGGNVVFEKLKTTNNKNEAPINEHTAFHLASVSKTFTAMSVVRLAQQGKLNLNDEVSKYFPNFNYPGVTIKTLLNHRSGLPNYLYFMERMWPDKKKFIKNQDILDYLINKKDSLDNIGKPDTRFSYCNTNYALLALLIEKVTNMSYPEYIKKTIFKPLHMDDSFVYVPEDSATVLLSYDSRNRAIPLNYLDDVYGDKNIYSTTHDLMQWDRLLRTNLFVSDSNRQAAFSPYSNERPGIKNYGFGWHLNIYPDGKKLVFHNGWWHGNTSAFIRLIDEDVTIIALNNHMSYVTYKSKLLANIFYPYFGEDVEVEQ